MSPRKLAIALLIILVIFDVLRESKTITFDKYSYDYHSDLTDNWDSKKIEVEHSDDSTIASLRPTLGDRCNYNGSIKNVPVMVRYEKEFLGKIDTGCSQLNITVISFDPGLMWTPIYKNASFKAKAVCNDRIPILKEDPNGNIIETEYQLTCTFEISGRLKVYGLCTYREARRLLLEQIFESLLKRGEKHLLSF